MEIATSVAVCSVSSEPKTTILRDEYLPLDVGTVIEEVSLELEDPRLTLYAVVSGSYVGQHFVLTKEDAQRIIK